jgi:predicted SAM-dependent methyltransferase
MSNLSKLHLGCGPFTPAGWLNVDGSLNARLEQYPRTKRLLGALRVIPRSLMAVPWSRQIVPHDLRKPLPWPDGRFEAVYASHTLEHLFLDEAQRLLRECFRVLRPGGRCRMVVPDLAYIVEKYARGDADADARFPAGAKLTRADSMNLHLLYRDPVFRPGGWKVKLYDAFFDFHGHKWMYDEESLIVRMQEAGFTDVCRRGYLETGIAGLEEAENRDRVEAGGLAVEGVRP